MKKQGNIILECTTNVERRLGEHNSGQTASLKYKRPLNVAFYQEYETMSDARKIEKKLKLLKSRKILEKIIQEKRIEMGP